MRQLLFLMLLAAGTLRAQEPVAKMYDDQVTLVEHDVLSLAEAMPADKYSWAPMEGVATVVSVYMHIARYNYMYPQENLGIESPMGAAAYGRWEAEVTDKAEAVAILAASMDHVRGVIDGMSDADLNAETRLYGRQVGEWAVLLQLVAHMNEHLGQSIAYARMNRVVPPWSS